MKPILVDTGVAVALLDRSEKFHLRCAELIESLDRPLVTCEAVIAESCYLLRDLSGAGDALLENVDKGVLQIPFQLSRSSAGVRRLLHKYRDVPIAFADACLVHLAEDLGADEILTLDRDFEVYRWGKNKPFRILINR